MTTATPSRRTWIMTIRRFAEVAWTRHGPTRYVSVALTPILVALLVPGWWWALCSLGAVVGVMIDLRIQAAFNKLAVEVEDLDDAAIALAVNNHVIGLAAITAAYVAPYAALAFAPQPRPSSGFCSAQGRRSSARRSM